MLHVNSTTIWGRFALRNVHSEILNHGVVLEPSSEDPDSLPSVSAIHSPIPLWAEANPPIVKMRKLESPSRSTSLSRQSQGSNPASQSQSRA